MPGTKPYSSLTSLSRLSWAVHGCVEQLWRSARGEHTGHGVYDHVTAAFSYYIADEGVGTKDSSMVINYLLLALIEMHRGQKVLVLEFDCAATNRNPILYVGLPVLLVQLGVRHVPLRIERRSLSDR